MRMWSGPVAGQASSRRARWAARAAASASGARAKAAQKASPTVRNTTPLRSSIAVRTKASWRARAAGIAFDLADGGDRAAHARGQGLLGQVERLAAPLQPSPERRIAVHDASVYEKARRIRDRLIVALFVAVFVALCATT